MIDVARDPRWGRVVEGYGEDPYLNGVFAAAAVRGYQGEDLADPESIAACLKHFVGYGASEGGRDYSYTDVSARALWETYLPPYRMGVEAGAATIMSSFNDITGIPAVANAYTLTEILRNRWGFEGFVVSDWASVAQLAAQGFSSSAAVQTERCLRAGNDMDMADEVYRNIPQLVAGGQLEEAVVDEAVRRVLRIKFRMGLFEEPYFAEKPFDRAFLLPEYKSVAEDLAAESVVLLKNHRSVLPLDKGDGVPRLAVIGPAGADADAMLGSWRCLGRADDVVSIADGLRSRLSDEVPYAAGCDYADDDRSGFEAAVTLAREADVAILCLGEPSNWSGENASRAAIELPVVQEELLDSVKATGTPIVLLLVGGRPLGLQRLDSKVDAILQVWQPGTMAGTAVADILLGRRNPSGKLAVSFPRSTGHIPTYYCEHSRARPAMGLYKGVDTDAIYEFGHGLSYTTFEYGELELSADKIAPGDVVTATVEVRNTGERGGTETVLWYVRDPEASITQPIRRLVAFQRIEIGAGRSTQVSLEIDPQEHLSYPDTDGKRVLEPGLFVIEASRKVQRELTLVE
jgi:beta-glucosidase